MDANDCRLINVGVEMEKGFPADLIDVDISLSGQYETREECTEAYNDLMSRVRKALEGIGIPDTELKNQRFGVFPHIEQLYKRDDARAGYYVALKEIRGYEFDAQLHLERPYSESEAGAIWSSLSEFEDGPARKGLGFAMEFTLSDFEAAKTALLDDAVKEGRRRAEILAAAADAKVVGIHSISYEHSRSVQMLSNAEYARKAPSGLEPVFNPEDIEVSCSVEMQWEISLPDTAN